MRRRRQAPLRPLHQPLVQVARPMWSPLRRQLQAQLRSRRPLRLLRLFGDRLWHTFWRYCDGGALEMGGRGRVRYRPNSYLLWLRNSAFVGA